MRPVSQWFDISWTISGLCLGTMLRMHNENEAKLKHYFYDRVALTGQTSLHPGCIQNKLLLNVAWFECLRDE